ncbi:transposase [Nocardia sp. NPDC051990]|uniref:transposase n=1 Tax=Nocardia sp. NPDC051990 TaxID=3155285 RepID=UPI00343155FE
MVDGEALGRSRGGLGIKIHLAVDGRGLPMRVLLTGGQAGDNPQLLPLLDGIRVARTGAGRAWIRPALLIADKAYSHPSTRSALRRRQVRFVSPKHPDQIAHRAAKGSRGGRPPAFDRDVYQLFFARLLPEPRACGE